MSGGQPEPRVVLEVTVTNHAGVMLHVCSLFSRRAYNMEGMLCMPVGHGGHSRTWILVDPDQRLEQIERQLLKLEDVQRVRRRRVTHDLLLRLEALFGGPEDGAI